MDILQFFLSDIFEFNLSSIILWTSELSLRIVCLQPTDREEKIGMTQIPVIRCQYCGSQDIGESRPHGEALVIFKYHGLLGNRLK